jgi:hypothetical protein
VGPFEYLLTFLSIVLGLAIADLCVSLNRLLGAGPRVGWDWLSPLAALVAFLKIVTQWWTWFFAAPLAKGVTFEMFLAALTSAVLLYLIAAAALPDSVEEGVDLRAYFERTRRRYWLLFAAEFALTNAVSAWAQIQVQGARFSWLAPGYLILPAAVALAFVRFRPLQIAAFCALTVIYLVQFAGRSLAG